MARVIVRTPNLESWNQTADPREAGRGLQRHQERPARAASAAFEAAGPLRQAFDAAWRLMKRQVAASAAGATVYAQRKWPRRCLAQVKQGRGMPGFLF